MITDKKNYKIYVLKDPITLEIRYIGVTTRKLNERLSQHVWEGNTNRKTHKVAWIKGLLKNNKIPIIELWEECTEDNWEEREKYWISSYSQLTNTLEGGKGLILDRTYSSVQRSTKAKCKMVVQLDKEGNYINTFESIITATTLLGFKSSSSITNVLKKSGNSKYAGDYYWVYKKDYELNNYILPNKKIKSQIPVIIKNLITNKQIPFSSTNEAAIYMEVSRGTASQAKCRGSICNKNFVIYNQNNKDIV